MDDASPAHLSTTPPTLRRFAASLRELASRRQVDETLQLAVDLAAELVRGCTFADLMFIGQGGATTPVSTGEVARAIDAFQDATGQGPCLDAATTREVVVAEDLRTDARWPDFGPHAAELGVRSVAAYQLFLHRNEDDRFGSLNLYGDRPKAFDEVAVELGAVFAAHCAAVLAAAIAHEGARAALESRDRIGQAKGVLMARHSVTASEAFEQLRTVSQERNIKLRDLADLVAERGELP